MTTTFVNGRVLLPDGIQQNVCVVVAGDRIEAISDSAPEGTNIVDLMGDLLLPGFIDVQVNGGGGRLFNEDPSVETVGIMAAAHRRFGTTGLLPTLISDDLSVVRKGISAVEEAIEARVPGILGIHIEGPFLSPARRGIHLASMLQDFDDRLLEMVASARRGKVVVTVAPECVTPSQIARLVQAGAVVCAGHSDADYETVKAAINAGASGFTHLFNGMSQLTNRAPGMVGAALEDRSTYAGIIIDGYHLHPASFRVALNAKGSDRLMLVTDAMAAAGSEEREFTLQGHTISREGQRLVNEDGVLAGSTLTMVEAVANAIEQGQISLPTAVQMASLTPARFLGLQDETGAIAPGLRADLVVVRADFTVVSSWIGGKGVNSDGMNVSAK
jgi:N-acetylglucosamine-6-phosphate deacetylase